MNKLQLYVACNMIWTLVWIVLDIIVPDNSVEISVLSLLVENIHGRLIA